MCLLQDNMTFPGRKAHRAKLDTLATEDLKANLVSMDRKVTDASGVKGEFRVIELSCNAELSF